MGEDRMDNIIRAVLLARETCDPDDQDTARSAVLLAIAAMGIPEKKENQR